MTAESKIKIIRLFFVLIFMSVVIFANYLIYSLFDYYEKLRTYDILVLYVLYIPLLILISTISIISLYLYRKYSSKKLFIISISTGMLSICLGTYKAFEISKYIIVESIFGEYTILEFINDSIVLFIAYMLFIFLIFTCFALFIKSIPRVIGTLERIILEYWAKPRRNPDH